MKHKIFKCKHFEKNIVNQMKRFGKCMTLRARITLLSGVMLIVCSVLLTTFSMWNARHTLVPLIGTQTSTIPASPLEEAEMVTETEESMEVAATLEALQVEARTNFDLKSIGLCFFISLLGMAGTYYITGKALRPVKSLSHEISGLNERRLSLRLPEPIAKDEVGELTKQFNDMLERLEEAFENQKRFTANAAHELKTPLATMKTGIQVLQRDKKAAFDEYKENAIVMERSVDRLGLLVNDLLFLASSGTETVDFSEEIMLDAIFEAIIGELEPLYEDRCISVKMELTADTLCGNTSLLYRAFYNLIENAYKYNRESGYIRIQSYFNDDKTVSVCIYNSGTRIQEEQRKLIFEPFYRIDQSRSRKTAGSGLGLSIVKSVMELHHAQIQVMDGLEEEICFNIIFP